jgi:magnesium-transporting ATPase (P-type)
MAKSVADVVLVRGDFGAVPHMVAEGRKILRNLQRVAKLYVSKSAFAVFLILTVGTSSTAYPLLPRHFSLAAALTIGIPTFFLALAPSAGSWRTTGFLREIGRFAVPAGVAAGVGVVASYHFALNSLSLDLIEARTVATTALVSVGLFLVIVLERTTHRRGRLVTLLCLCLGAAYAAALALPPTREFFELAAPTPAIVATALVGAALAVLGLVASGFPPAARAGGEERVET